MDQRLLLVTCLTTIGVTLFALARSKSRLRGGRDGRVAEPTSSRKAGRGRRLLALLILFALTVAIIALRLAAAAHAMTRLSGNPARKPTTPFSPHL